MAKILGDEAEKAIRYYDKSATALAMANGEQSVFEKWTNAAKKILLDEELKKKFPETFREEVLDQYINTSGMNERLIAYYMREIILSDDSIDDDTDICLVSPLTKGQLRKLKTRFSFNELLSGLFLYTLTVCPDAKVSEEEFRRIKEDYTPAKLLVDTTITSILVGIGDRLTGADDRDLRKAQNPRKERIRAVVSPREREMYGVPTQDAFDPCVGRNAFLAELDKRISKNKIVFICATTGGGEGKTTAANAYCWSYAQKRFHRIYWVRVDGESMDVREDIMSAAMLEFEPDTSVNTGENFECFANEINGEWINNINKVLLVIDGCETGSQIDSIITSIYRSLRCKILVTSRVPLTAEYKRYQMTLPQLEKEACKELFYNRCSVWPKNDYANLDGIIELLGHHPLLIMLVASIGKNLKDCNSVDELYRRMEEAGIVSIRQFGSELCNTIIKEIIGKLTQLLQYPFEALRLLSFFSFLPSRPIDSDILFSFHASYGGFTWDELAQTCLERLVHDGWLESPSPYIGARNARYSCHSLVRAAIRESAEFKRLENTEFAQLLQSGRYPTIFVMLGMSEEILQRYEHDLMTTHYPF
ncbi:MAG: NB-ARC domain-containing protein [Oscillospiraceae bacterium]|nr:NB-ARC domain-containing protein [Oscillospiraceae bacterium]